MYILKLTSEKAEARPEKQELSHLWDLLANKTQRDQKYREHFSYKLK